MATKNRCGSPKGNSFLLPACIVYDKHHYAFNYGIPYLRIHQPAREPNL